MKTLRQLLETPRCPRLLASWVVFAIVFAVSTLNARQCSAQLCGQLNGLNYSQNFDTLSVSGSSNNMSSLPIGFTAVESGTGGNITYSASDGFASTVNTYSYGAGTATDRALGELGSTTFSSTLGACFVNNTDHAITSFVVGYTGEEWRLGVADGTVDALNFQFSTNATGLTDGTWTDVDSLDFTTPNNAAAAGALNGNAAANRTAIAPFAITPAAPIQPERTFFIRWVPVALATANDGLAIDDFTLGAAYAFGLAGDYNNDKRVDGADYVIFRNNLNQSVTIPNDITPGTVTASDYNEWRQRYGKVNPPSAAGSSTASATSTSVPEPSTWLLFAATAFSVFVRKRYK